MSTIGILKRLRLPLIGAAPAMILAGTLASAQAAPMAPVHANPMIAPSYEGAPHHLHHHWHHHRYGVNAHPGHPGYAGLYDCGPGGKTTRLSRRACGGHDRFRHLQTY